MLRGLLFGQSVAILACASALAQPAPKVDLVSRPGAAEVVRVKAHFEAGGELTMSSRDGKPQKVPLSVVADLRYDERVAVADSPQAPAAADEDAATAQYSLRYYDEARATIKIGSGGADLSLPDDRRLIVASTTKESADLFSPSGPLTREELDLIDIPAGTHLLSRLAPGASQRVGESWKHDAQALRLLLGLDAVEQSDVASTLLGVERGYAKLRLDGSLKGTTDGAPTELQVKAGYLFDTRLGRITRLNLAFAEKREEGRIGPALDVTGRLSLEIDPLSPDVGTERLGDERWASVLRDSGADQKLLEVKDDATGLRLVHDRNWYVTSEERERLVLRRVDDGEFIAQCNISIRPERQEGRQTTMPEFERDVRFSLAGRFETLVTSGQWTNAAGLLCYRMVVHGKVDDLPMEWRYYLASPPAGRSVALAFSVEPHVAERLGDADMALVESIELATAEPSTQPPAQDLKTSARQSSRTR